MKKPILGDYLNLRYEGATHRVRCDDISEAPQFGPGAANFTIVSEIQFHRGHDAHLLLGATELLVHVDRVSVVGARRRNIVQLHGIFDEPGHADQPASIISA